MPVTVPTADALYQWGRFAWLKCPPPDFLHIGYGGHAPRNCSLPCSTIMICCVP